ncbi:MAG: LD-carboxypeptidase, partial [Firmicutes bacterium]|nr:LD-carboxypeptidase [Bacillota bacterium]
MKPKALRPGDTIALLAPASPLPAHKLHTAIASIESMGLKPRLFPSCFAEGGYLAGPDKQRAQDVMDAFIAPEVRGIFCLRGGYGCSRILPLLDFTLIAENPKIFLGYSDITALHTALNQLCGLPTIHGPMLNQDWREMDPLT